ncbi:MAG: cysteine desulfurase [Planctomycetes bacterium]|nr:cysteine desulfurase [Planctomycetota bacterium]
MNLIYLDNNATTELDSQVISAMAEAVQNAWGNPSSIHRVGQAARRQVDLARQTICDLIGCEDRELVFTSGGTESVNLAIRGSLEAHRRKKVFVTSRLEHSSVRDLAEKLEKNGTEVVWLKNANNGLIDLNCLKELLSARSDEIALVSIMWANNETGVIQPIAEIGSICQELGVHFHTDATQWVGKMPTDLSSLPIDLLSFAAHKFHGPLGAGGLFIKRGVRIEPQIFGGGHERGLRAGTENVAGIVGMAVAAKLAKQWLETNGREQVALLRDIFEQAIVNASDGASINGYSAPRMWDVTNIGFARLEAEAILMMLSEQGVCASAGAACSSGSIEPSAVLLAMGIDPSIAYGSLRFSLSRETTESEMQEAAEIVIGVVTKLRRSLASV